MQLIPAHPIKSPRLSTLAVALLATLVAAQADQIYVANDNGFAGDGSLGQYSTSGTIINSSLIPAGGLYLPQQMAVSGTNIFIGEAGINSIGEYTTSGATVNASLITGLNGPIGIVLSGTNLFVANNGGGTIGEYSTSGATITNSLVTGLTNPQGLALYGTNLFVGNTGTGVVGEYSTSGATVSSSLLSGFTGLGPLAVSGPYLFVFANGTIGEYTVLGVPINPSLITGLGLNVQSLVADGTQLFVNQRGNNFGDGSVYEFTLGAIPGTVASTNTSFITGLYEPTGLAVGIPSPALGLAPVGNQSVLYWPVSSATYAVQTITNLAATNWMTVSNGTPITGITLTNALPAAYFRLQQQ